MDNFDHWNAAKLCLEDSSKKHGYERKLLVAQALDNLSLSMTNMLRPQANEDIYNVVTMLDAISEILKRR